MGEKAGFKPSMLKPFAIGYLVWHILTSLITLALLGHVSVNFFALANFRALTMPVLGFTVNVGLLVIAGWVIYVLLVLAGLAFGLGAIGVWKGFSRHALAVGRVMLVLCVLNLVFGLVQANILTILSEGITILLTGALIHELNQEARESLEVSAGWGDATGDSSPQSNAATHMNSDPGSATNNAVGSRRAAVVPTACDACSVDVCKTDSAVPPAGEQNTNPSTSACSRTTGERDSPVPVPAFDEESRKLQRLFEGYVLIMFVWGALRVLSGLAVVFNGGFAVTDEPSVRRVVTGGLIALVGLYLVVTGRYGKAALSSTEKLAVFRRLGIIGLVLSVLGFAPTLVWAVSSAQLLSSDMFCSAINLALFAASVYYADALEKSLKSF